MPVPLLASEVDPNKASKMQPFKYSEGTAKAVFPAYYTNGAEGEKDIIPHAMHCYDVINRISALNEQQKALAFMMTLYGGALTDAQEAFTEHTDALSNHALPQDEQKDKEISTFEDFIKDYCGKAGHDMSKHNQLEGLRYLKKPNNMPTERWKTTLTNKNKAVSYCKGDNEVPLTNTQFKHVLFGSFPKKWKDEFSSNGTTNIAGASIPDIMKFMRSEEAKAMAKVAIEKARQEASHQTERKHKLKQDEDETRPTKRTKRNDNNNEQTTNTNWCHHKRCKDKEKHLWKDCPYNKYSKNHKPKEDVPETGINSYTQTEEPVSPGWAD